MHTHTTHTRPNAHYIIVRTEYTKSTTLGGLTTGAEMAEPHSPPLEEQAVPGSILDEAPLLSIVDLQRFAVRPSKVCSQVGQAGGTLQYRGH